MYWSAIFLASACFSARAASTSSPPALPEKPASPPRSAPVAAPRLPKKPASPPSAPPMAVPQPGRIMVPVAAPDAAPPSVACALLSIGSSATQDGKIFGHLHELQGLR